MGECIFCAILAGKAPANFVYQDELCAAFMDIRPVNPGHVLVVPRVHAVLITELEDGYCNRLIWVAKKVDAALRRSRITCEAVNLFLADGRAAGQEVLHVHLHVIPRYQGDGHHLRFSPKYFSPTATSELEKNAMLITEQMDG